MRYMIRIDHGPGILEFGTEEQGDAETRRWFEFTRRFVESGDVVSGEPTRHIETATIASVCH